MTDLSAFTAISPSPFARNAKVFWACLGLMACHAMAQTPASSDNPGVIAPLTSHVAASAAAPHSSKLPAPSPRWQSLTQRQQQALAPLGAQWDSLTAQQQKKWLTISNSFLQLTDEEQMTMHGRMSDWAALSPKARNQARFNFNSALSLPIEDKRAQWMAYQSLPEEDREHLSSGPKPPVKSAARTTLPTGSRLVSPPALPVKSPKVIPRVAPSQPVDPKTLLPKLAPQ